MRELDTFLKEKNKKQAGKERRNRKRLSEFTVKEEMKELAACRNLYALSYWTWTYLSVLLLGSFSWILSWTGRNPIYLILLLIELLNLYSR